MTSFRFTTIVAAFVLSAMSLPAAQEGTTAAQAFEHYEAVRTALAGDTLKEVDTHAKALTPLAEELAGPAARKAGEQLASAKDIEAARLQFGTLSEALVPKFMEADLPGVKGFMCEMKKKPWVQQGEKVENPYYGKSMATCGTPMKAAK
ncbi:MAG: DUF3347 domain-containing protein [Luteitalea sp.]|nr:DUF3347 domain-containing protein [Luteitalea sp.]